VSSKTFVAVTTLAAIGAAGGVSGGANAVTRISCAPLTPLKADASLRLGQVRVAGFDNAHCAAITLRCRPSYQATLSLESATKLSSPVVLRAGRAEPVTFFLVGSKTPAPKIPRCLSGSGGRAKVSLDAPDMYFVLFVFAHRNMNFHLTARQGGRLLASAVVKIRGAR
jgi:hypothetical protein